MAPAKCRVSRKSPPESGAQARTRCSVAVAGRWAGTCCSGTPPSPTKLRYTVFRAFMVLTMERADFSSAVQFTGEMVETVVFRHTTFVGGDFERPTVLRIKLCRRVSEEDSARSRCLMRMPAVEAERPSVDRELLVAEAGELMNEPRRLTPSWIFSAVLRSRDSRMTIGAGSWPRMRPTLMPPMSCCTVPSAR